MAARRMLKTPLALFGALSLACAGERSVAPPLPPSFSLQHATSFYEQHNLVSDGAVSADLVDAALVNAWGLVASATSPFWVADNGTGLSTLYNGNTGGKISLTVSVPGAPTGIVFSGGADFVVTSGTRSGPARFIFASEDGTISGWNPAVAATQAIVGVDHSAGGAVYKGLAIASTASGVRLYATNFHAGTVHVFDAGFHPVSGGFTDGHINAFDLPRRHGKTKPRGQLEAADGRPIVIDGLWALAFGNGATAGPTNVLFFTAGPFGEAHGLFGKLVVSAAGQSRGE